MYIRPTHTLSLFASPFPDLASCSFLSQQQTIPVSLPTKVPYVVMSTAGESGYEFGWKLVREDGTSVETLPLGVATTVRSDNPYYGIVAVTPGSPCQVTLRMGVQALSSWLGSWWLGMGQAFTYTENTGGTFSFAAPAATLPTSQLPATAGVATSVNEIRGALNAIEPGGTVDPFCS